jgi:hypothetical protein
MKIFEGHTVLEPGFFLGPSSKTGFGHIQDIEPQRRQCGSSTRRIS